MNLSPGADLKKLQQAKPGETVTLSAGLYKGGSTLSNLHGFTLDLTGAVFVGGTNGLKFVNCRDFQVIGGETQDAGAYGWFFEGCASFTLSGSRAVRSGTTGFLTTKVQDANFLQCSGLASLTQWGLYLSEKATKARVVGGEYSHNARGGIQCNFDKGGGTDIEVRDLLVADNQRAGHAAAIQFAYVNNGRILNCDIRDHCGRTGIEVWQRSRAVTVDGNQFSFAKGYGGGGCVNVQKGSAVVVGPLNRAAAGVPLCVRE
jgi:hypothetical protein